MFPLPLQVRRQAHQLTLHQQSHPPKRLQLSIITSTMNNYLFWENIPRPWDGRAVPRSLRHRPFDYRHQPTDAQMHDRLYREYGPGYRRERDAVFHYNGGWVGGLGLYRYHQQQQVWNAGWENGGRPPRYGGFH